MTAGRIPSARLREPEPRPALGDDEVGDGAQPHPAAERGSVHPRDDGHGAGVDRLEHVGHGHRVLLVALDIERARRAHPGEVGAGTERRPVAGQDDGAQGSSGASRARAAKMVRSSAISDASKALWTSGRASVTRATTPAGPLRSRRDGRTHPRHPRACEPRRACHMQVRDPYGRADRAALSGSASRPVRGLGSRTRLDELETIPADGRPGSLGARIRPGLQHDLADGSEWSPTRGALASAPPPVRVLAGRHFGLVAAVSIVIEPPEALGAPHGPGSWAWLHEPARRWPCSAPRLTPAALGSRMSAASAGLAIGVGAPVFAVVSAMLGCSS